MTNRATLKFKTGPLSGKAFSLGPGEYFFIGSSESCAVRIPDDPLVEASHAAVFYDPSGKLLFKDMGTNAGTYVNGKRISKSVPLKAGDRVTIGQFSTFQSSWWNALQATRLTRFSNIRINKSSDKGQSAKLKGNVVKGIIATVALAVAVVAYKDYSHRSNFSVVLDGDDRPTKSEARGVAADPKDLGIFSGTLSSRLFREKAKKPGRKRIEMTPERQFIWDEIVAISRRFGDPPPSAMDPGFIQEVERHIARFTKYNHHQTLLARKAQFAPAIERALIAKGLPPELGYIVWVESNYKVDAKSPVGALGLWQFMPETGVEYGLKVSGSIDERLDPAKATDAAADYFISLLRMFGTERYLLAIASYNTGQNRVKRKQIETTVHKGHTSDFWQIRTSLPNETAEYVPKVIAAIIIGRNPKRYSDLAH